MSTRPGRNDPCPCGSGKKYKKCCAEKDQSAPRPVQTALLYREALALYGKGDLVGAQKRFAEVVAADPRHADALCMLGVIEGRLGNLSRSTALIRQAIAIDGNNAEFYYNLALTLVGLKDPAGAAEAFSQAIRLNPKDSRYFNNLASLLLDQKQFEQAVPGLQRALELDPNNAEAWNNLGVALDNLGHFAEARRALERAIELAPNNASAHSNLGEVMISLKGQAAALPHFERAVQLMPQHPAFRKNLSRALLAAGQIERGFTEHEARLPLFLGTYARFPWKRWQGEDLVGKTIVVTPEQGVGDEIMFANCLPDLIAAAGKVVVLCDPRLVALFARSFPDAIVLPNPKDNDTARFDEYGPIDFQVAIGSLPRFYRKHVDDFPHYEDGFLAPDQARVEHWKQRLAELGEGLKVGICWRSGHITAKRAKAYTEIDEWGPVFAVPGVQFVNLQYDECGEELAHARERFGVRIANLGGTEIDLKNDLDECAALYRALDLVISPGTAVSSLSGAISAKTWLIGGVGWVRLGTNGHPWYPRVTIVRPQQLVKLYADVKPNLLSAAIGLAAERTENASGSIDWPMLVERWYDTTDNLAFIGHAVSRKIASSLSEVVSNRLLEIDKERGEQLVERLYREDPDARDSYARLGALKFRDRDWTAAAGWYEKDHAIGRISPTQLVNLAIVRIWLDDMEGALALVEEAYIADLKLRNGYARLGWNGYLHGLGEVFLRDQVSKDTSLDRLSSKGQLFRALSLAGTESFDEEMRNLESIYFKDARLRNWLAIIGWRLVNIGNAEVGCELMGRDYRAGRIDKAWLPAYALALAKSGDSEQAHAVVEEAWAGVEDTEIRAIGYPIRPDVMLNAVQLREFITQEKCSATSSL